MTKMKLRIYAIFLVCCLIGATPLSVVAQENYLGTDDDLSGYIVSDDYNGQTRVHDDFSQESGDLIGNNPLIFSLTAAEVTSLLTSKVGGKSFTTSQLPATAIRIICRGTLSHSLQDIPGITGSLQECVEAGVCFYGYSSMYHDYVFQSVYTTGPHSVGLGQQFEGSFLIEGKLKSNETYYSYVKNTYPAGYVFGTLNLYYSSV